MKKLMPLTIFDFRMKKISILLNSPLASILFIAISILSRIINIFYVSYAGRDKMFLVMQSKSLLNGKGLGVPEYFTDNPDLTVYDYTPMWPPGYPIVLAPFLELFNFDIYLATTTLDIVACIALIFVIRQLCFRLNFPVIAVNLMTLIAGCFEYTFINDSKPTDNIPIVIFIAAISLLIKILQTDRFSWLSIMLVAFLLFLPNFFRYSYPPLSVAVPISVIFIGFLKNETLIKKKGAWLLVLTSVMIAGFLLIMKATTGYAGYAVPSARGFFPENIVHWFPIVPGSFINIAFLTSQTHHIAGLSLEKTMNYLEIINTIVILSLIVLFPILFFNKRFLAEVSPFKLFLIIGFFTSAATFVSLGYLSLTYALQRWGDNIWSYVYDHRYYVFVVLFLQIAFIGWVFLYKYLLKNWLLRIFLAMCSFTIFVEVTHNIYFHTKVALNFKKYKSEVYREKDYAFFLQLLVDLEKNYPGHDIWSTGSGDDFIQYNATYRGHKGIKDAASFKTRDVKVNKKTILILMLYDNEIEEYREFLSASDVLFSKSIQNSNFYVIELLP